MKYIITIWHATIIISVKPIGLSTKLDKTLGSFITKLYVLSISVLKQSSLEEIEVKLSISLERWCLVVRKYLQHLSSSFFFTIGDDAEKTPFSWIGLYMECYPKFFAILAGSWFCNSSSKKKIRYGQLHWALVYLIELCGHLWPHEHTPHNEQEFWKLREGPRVSWDL